MGYRIYDAIKLYIFTKMHRKEDMVKIKSIKKNVIHMALSGIILVTVIFAICLYYLNPINSKEINYERNGEYIVKLNEVKKLYEAGEVNADEKLDSVIKQLRKENAAEESNMKKIIIVIYFATISVIISVFVYIYITILKPFDELQEYADILASGKMDIDFKYKRKNMFGKFTWAFDHMRNEIIRARECEWEAVENNKTVIATLSHDIKTPIASIRGYAEALTMNMDSNMERRIRYAEVIIRKCDEVTKITDDMFTHSLHNLNHLEIKQEKVDLKEIIEKTISDVSLGGDINIIGEIIPAVIYNGDAKRIQQVMENIIENTRKYAPDSQTDICTNIMNTGEIEHLNINSEKVYVLSFQDYGKGIPDEDIPFVFNKFYRGKNVGDKKGAGLGLFIVKYIMNQMDGDVRIANNNGLLINLYFKI